MYSFFSNVTVAFENVQNDLRIFSSGFSFFFLLASDLFEHTHDVVVQEDETAES